jgi:transposase-like protein
MLVENQEKRTNIQRMMITNETNVALPNKEGKKLSGKQLLKILDGVCKKDTTVMTDQFTSYGILDGKMNKDFIYIRIDHNTTY